MSGKSQKSRGAAATIYTKDFHLAYAFVACIVKVVKSLEDRS